MPDLSNTEQELLDANRIEAVAMLRCASSRAHGDAKPCAVHSPATRPSLIQSPTVWTSVEFDVRALVFVVDNDAHVRSALGRLLESNGLRVEAFADGSAFLEAYHRQDNACLLADTGLSDFGGLSLLLKLGGDADPMPVIMITDSSDIRVAVGAMKAGAVDFLEKPIGGEKLIASVMSALAAGRLASIKVANRGEALHHFEALTPRQRQIMVLVLSGHPSKNIAADLGISQRTVENHRAAVMRKSGSKSLPALARLAMTAGATLPN